MIPGTAFRLSKSTVCEVSSKCQLVAPTSAGLTSSYKCAQRSKSLYLSTLSRHEMKIQNSIS